MKAGFSFYFWTNKTHRHKISTNSFCVLMMHAVQLYMPCVHKYFWLIQCAHVLVWLLRQKKVCAHHFNRLSHSSMLRSNSPGNKLGISEFEISLIHSNVQKKNSIEKRERNVKRSLFLWWFSRECAMCVTKHFS